MVFRPKVDAFFIKFILIAILLIGLVSFLPLFIEGGPELLEVLIVTATFLVLVSIILWCSFSIKYVFYKDYLFVKGGPFRSRIPYESITKVLPTSSIFIGYRILSSRDAIEIFYKTSMMGSVKISPENQRAFIAELNDRCQGNIPLL